MRAAEEPQRSDLDVAGLRAQVLVCIEELEARVREGGDIVRACARDGKSRLQRGSSNSGAEGLNE